jgi:hypothetical protein
MMDSLKVPVTKLRHYIGLRKNFRVHAVHIVKIGAV